jgi:hypothetical protein
MGNPPSDASAESRELPLQPRGSPQGTPAATATPPRASSRVGAERVSPALTGGGTSCRHRPCRPAIMSLGGLWSVAMRRSLSLFFKFF